MLVTVIALDEGQIAIFALVDDLSAHEVVAIGSVVEVAFEPAIAAAGQTFTSYSGGTVAELMAALAAAGATSATATSADGSTVTMIVTTLGFVNADFNAAFSKWRACRDDPGSAVAQLRANSRRASRWLRPPGRPRRD